jgi:autotransporter-associated beta strand protein
MVAIALFHSLENQMSVLIFRTIKLPYMQPKLRLLLMTFYVIFSLIITTSIFGQAVVSTDSADYHPGSTVMIRGSGFVAGETITLQIIHARGGDNVVDGVHAPWNVVADADGNIAATWLVPKDRDELGATLLLTADAKASNLHAEKYFTDATITITTSVLWTSITTGSGAKGQPSSSDAIVVKGGGSLTVDITSATCLSVQLGESINTAPTGSNAGDGTLTFTNGKTITCSGNVTLGESIIGGRKGTLIMSNGGQLLIGGSLTINTGSTFDPGTASYGGTVEYNAFGPQEIFPAVYNHLTVSGGGVKSLTGATNARGTVAIRAGVTLDLSGFDFGQTNAPSKLVLETGTSAGSTITGTTGKFTLGGSVSVNQSGTGASGAFISALLNLGSANRTFTVTRGASNADLTISRTISGIGAAVTKSGTGIMQISSVNTYNAGTGVSAGIIGIGNNVALGSSKVSLAGTDAPTIMAVDGPKTISNDILVGSATIGKPTIGGSSDFTINGTITNYRDNMTLLINNTGMTTFAGAILLSESTANRNFTIAGPGSVTVTGAIVNGSSAGSGLTYSGTGIMTLTNSGNNHSGSTIISSGEVRLNPGSTSATFASPIVLNGGKLSTINIGSDVTWTSASTLKLSQNSSIDLGINGHSIRFARADTLAWSGSQLTINGWKGSPGSSGTGGKIFFGTSSGTLTAIQLGKISFAGYPGTPILLSTGELVPPISCSAPTITTQPTSASVVYGANGSFSVAAIGTEPSYQWQISADDGASWNNISTLLFSGYSDYTTATLNLVKPNAGMNGYQYRCIVSNTCGSVISNVLPGAAAILTITRKQLTVTAPGVTTTKPYDGTTTAQVTPGSLTGVVSTDEVSLDAEASYNTKDAGTDKTITVVYSLSGTDKDNYDAPVNHEVTGAVITRKQLTVSAPGVTTTKPYDGTTAAQVTPGTPEGVLDGDELLVTAEASYDTKDAGTDKTITVVYSLSGTDKDNYDAPEGYTTPGVITRKPLTVTAPGVTTTKPYDGTTTAQVSPGTPEGVLDGDELLVTAEASYDSKDAGTGKTITVVYSLSGADKDNYDAPEGYTTTGVITRKQLSTGTFSVVTTKVYDGTTTAAVTAAQLQNVIAGENPLLNAIAYFVDKNEGRNKQITVEYNLTGAEAGNYIAPPRFVVMNGIINPRDLTITATAYDKVFDNSTTAAVTLSSDQLSGDDIHINYVSADFVDPGAGIQTVNVNGVSISGVDAHNYNLLNESASTIARITAAGTFTELHTSANSVRFMDNITLTAQVTPQKGEGVKGVIQFKINGVNFGTAVAVVPVTGDVLHRAVATLTQQVDKMPGSYNLTADFSSSTSNYNSSSSQSVSLPVYAREASPYLSRGFYTGDVFAWTTSVSSSKGTLTLAATVQDVNTPHGDVRAAKVTFFTVTASGLAPIQGATDLPVGLVDVDDATLGTASAIVQFDIGAQNAVYYNIVVRVSGGYTNDITAACAQKQITIAKPILIGYTSGGGDVSNERSSGFIKGASDKVTDFEFDITYTKSGSNPKGKSSVWVHSYYRPDGTLDSKIHTYWIQSTAISLLAITQNSTTGPTCDFSSKANLYEQMSDRSLVLIEGGAVFQMQASHQCLNQQIAITLYRKAGGVWFSSNWVSTKTLPKPISDGHVYVFGGDSACKALTGVVRGGEPNKAINGMGEEQVSFSGIAYPNPTQSQFNIKLKSSDTHDPITIMVYSVNGYLIEQRKNLYAGQTIQLGALYRSGVYIMEIMQGTRHRQMKLMKISE